MAPIPDPLRQQVLADRIAKARAEAALKKQKALDELQVLELELERRKLQDFKYFVYGAWHIVEPTEVLRWNWHLDELCIALERSALPATHSAHIHRGIINVPPGTMKSLLVSVFFRAWRWSADPSLRFLTGSYSSHLSIRDNVKLRTIVTSPWYRKHFPKVELTGDQNAKEKFETTAGGWSYATSVGGGGTGDHPDYIIIDDPVSAQQARSKAEREAANGWIDRTLSTRGVVRNAVTWLIMQRLDELDPSGHLLARGSWEHICFPMRYELPEYDKSGKILRKPDPRDIRTVPGELLWPELYNQQKVKQLEIDLGPYGAAGQLQQRPAPEGGGLFQRGWFKFVDAVPKGARRCRGWDTAATEGGGDDTVGVRMAELDGDYYVEDVTVVNLGPGGVNAHIVATAELDGVETAIREEREPGSSGISVIAARAKALVGYDYAGVSISGDKVTRAKPFRTQVEAGNVYLVRAPWNEAYLQELEHFPVGAKDNRVDASSCAFNALLAEERVCTSATWGRAI